jgi:hypothetical protein
LTAQLGLTPKCLAASRREWPARTRSTMRDRKSNEELWPMIDLPIMVNHQSPLL